MSARSRRRSAGLPPFTPLVHQYFLTQQFAVLSPRAVKLLIELWMQFRGANNGSLCAAWSVMRQRGWTSKDQLAKALKELETANWIVRTRQGGINRPTLYAVTFRGIDPCAGKLDVAPDPRPSHAWRESGHAPTRSARRVHRAPSPARHAGHDAPGRGPITASMH